MRANTIWALSGALWALAGCGEMAMDGRTYSADEVTAGPLAEGQEITVRGTVTTITYAQGVVEGGMDGDYVALPTRYLLLQTDEAHQNRSDGWGLGVELSAAALADRSVRPAQRGDQIRVRGRLTTLTWDVEGLPKATLVDVRDYQIEKPASDRVLRDLGEPCSADLDCADDLWCERGGVCGPVPPLTWFSDLRNINGSCLRDEDCPTGQHCDPNFRIAATGDYSPNYFKTRDAGRFLCQVNRTAPASAICPHPVDLADFLGGRYPQGKEICARAQIAFPLLAPDRDTHVQGEVPWPYRYPNTQPALGPFGAAMENAPMYKDPTNPLGPLVDPIAHSTVDIVGTVHFDNAHGWWELHPIKWVGAVAAHP